MVAITLLVWPDLDKNFLEKLLIQAIYCNGILNVKNKVTIEHGVHMEVETLDAKYNTLVVSPRLELPHIDLLCHHYKSCRQKGQD